MSIDRAGVPTVQASPPHGSVAEWGEPIRSVPGKQISLGGRENLWLVTGEPIELFAVNSDQLGPLHFIGVLEPGSAIAGSGRGANHTLVGRPMPGCVLRRIWLGDIRTPNAAAHRATPGPGAAETELFAAVDRGIDVLHQAIRPDPPSQQPSGLTRRTDLAPGQVARPGRGLVWAEVNQGRVWPSSVGSSRARDAGETFPVTPNDWMTADEEATVTVHRTVELYAAGVLPDRLAQHSAQYLQTLDRHLATLHDQNAARLTAGRNASAEAVSVADRALRNAAQSFLGRTHAATDGAGDDAAAACLLVAKAAGINLDRMPPPADGADERVDPVERFAAAARIRTRQVQLAGRWWRSNAGPLVGHYGSDRTPIALLWRLGGYDAVLGAGRREVDQRVASQIDPSAVMFYRSLPDKPTTGPRLLRFGLTGAWPDILRVIVGGLVGSGLGLIVPIVTGLVLGTFVPQAQSEYIVLACLAVVITAIASAAISMYSSVAVLRLEGRLDAVLQTAVWDRLLRLPAIFFTRYSTGEVANAAMGISGIRATLSGITMVAMSATLLGVVNFGLMLYYSVPLAMVALVVLLSHSVVFGFVGYRQLHWQRRLIEVSYKLSDRVYQTLRALPKLRVAGAESFAYARWATDFAHSRALTRNVERTQNIVTTVNAAYVPGATFVLYLLLSGPARGHLTLSEFLTFSSAFAVTLSAAVQLTTALSSAGVVQPMFDKIKPVLQERPEVVDGSTVPGPLSGGIEVANVSFRYTDGGPLILDDVSLQIKPGQFVAIVGPTGSGKSTLLRLLIGFNEPASGAVRYDGATLSQLDASEVRRQCGVVLQNSAPFSGSIQSNICGTSSYTMDEAWAAARMAGLDEDIKAMAMGMHTIVSDNAGTLSGGQRQRLMIAQALIRQPRIIFFDEATSALDNRTQAIVTDSMRRLSATRVVIAHRLSTIMNADVVYVLDQGKTMQSGTPAELLAATDGLFYKMVRRQIR
jgi:NHLM bacteriocin system ABC transporter ATP-binding protein